MSLLIDVAKSIQGKSIEKASKELQQRRLDTCEYCPFLEWGRPRSCGKFLVGGEVLVDGKKMELCGCNVDDKVKYLKDGCPLGKW
tara:strand:- start:2234 stop:2488 length:255 start_codon:yes stop_codon:yes gene_type:complete